MHDRLVQAKVCYCSANPIVTSTPAQSIQCLEATSVAAMLRTLPYMVEEPAVSHASRLPSPQSPGFGTQQRRCAPKPTAVTPVRDTTPTFICRQAG